MRYARLGVIFAGLATAGLAAWAEGCLFAPDDCKDLLQCSGKGGAGGGGSTSSVPVATSTSSGGCEIDHTCVACVIDTDCGPPTNDGCTVSTCVASVCTPKDTTGLPAATQTANDCKRNVCGANGKPTSVNDANDLPPDDGNACTDQTCAAGVPVFLPVAAGTVCANGTCDDKGNCVNCNTNADCTQGLNPTCDPSLHTCVSCSDGVKNGLETMVDCGGNCNICLGDPCANNAGCVSSQCTDGVCCDIACVGACQSCNLPGSVGACASVPAGQKDPQSCDTATEACDGAGMCKTAAGASCVFDTDCASGACLGGICRIQTGGDCANALSCASGRCVNAKCADCAVNGDCATGACSAPTCKAPGGAACDIDSDCAGNKCQFGLCLVDNGSACAVAADCRSGVCAGGVCGPCTGVPVTCSPGASCGSMAFGAIAGVCNRPMGAYCINNLQCEGLKPCKGFPATCQ
jgi:hypothetical protein